MCFKGYDNPYGRALSNMRITNKLCFLNGRTRGDRVGNFTCFTYNGAIVIDYAIVGHDVLENIIYFTVHPLTLLSNHCYISFALKTTTFRTDSSRVNFLSDSSQKFKWNEMSKDMFRNTLNSSEIFTSTEQLINKFCDLKHAPEQINIDEMISSTNSIIMRVAKSCLTQKQIKRKGRSGLNKGAFKKRKIWYDYSCSEARKIFESAAKNLSHYPKDPIVRGKYIKCKKQHKTLVKEKKRAFRESILKKIQQLEDKNSKEFWNLVRELRSKKDKNLSDNIDPEIWYDWLKKLNNANDTYQMTHAGL